jgi:hypothetical protein
MLDGVLLLSATALQSRQRIEIYKERVGSTGPVNVQSKNEIIIKLVVT